MTGKIEIFDRASRIKLLVETLDITGKDFGNQIGISQGMVSNLMNGKRPISLDVVDKITARYLDINPAWLLFGVGSMFNSQANSPPVGVSEKRATRGQVDATQPEIDSLTRRVEALERFARGINPEYAVL